MVTDPRAVGLWACIVAALPACGPQSHGAEGTNGATSSSSSSTTTSSESTTAAESSSGVPSPCWREIDGNLDVDENTDLAELADVRVVTGFLDIRLGDSPQEDLSFLGCLESAFLLDVSNSYNLVSTRGMVNLSELGNLTVGLDVPSLVAVEGFDAITEIDLISLRGASLMNVEFPALRIARTINYPGCDISDGGPPLESTGVFDSLESLEFLNVGGQVALTRITVLDALIANGAPSPERVEIVNNPMLPADEVEAQLIALGVPDEASVVCGTLGEELCKCPPEE